MCTVKGVMCHHTATATSPPEKHAVTLCGCSLTADPSAPPRWQLVHVATVRSSSSRPGAAIAGHRELAGYSTGNSQLNRDRAKQRPAGQPWPDVQIYSYEHGVAAILKKLRRLLSFCGPQNMRRPARPQ